MKNIFDNKRIVNAMRLIKIAQDYGKSFLDIFYPRHCLLCSDPLSFGEELICPTCSRAVIFTKDPFCKKCARPLVVSVGGRDGCYTCKSEKLPFEQLIALGIYEGDLKKCIHALKFEKKEYISKWFSDALVSFIESYSINIRNYDCIVPVPMHPLRKKERGFNQAELIARSLSKKLQIPYARGVLKRVKIGEVQSGLNKKKRQQNVEDAFVVTSPDVIKNNTVLLVDDIYTTGATVQSAARLLRVNGARKVSVCVLARGV
ncbi:MAG: ComF family protein [Candidatus Ancaeobacter aquaticus]|nr:ComF family protein [Candidatus Ancaeobacter aquaticus]